MAQHSWTWIILGFACLLTGCSTVPVTENDERPAALDTEFAQPEGRARHGNVEAMPVSMGAGVETIPGERIYIVTVQLQQGGQPQNFYPGQEFAVEYEVSKRDGTRVPNDQVILPTSPRYVVPKGQPAPAFKFLVQTTKAPQAGYTLRVLVHYGDVMGESPERPITQ